MVLSNIYPRLPFEIRCAIIKDLDAFTILSWGATAMGNRLAAKDVLSARLLAILDLVTSDPYSLLGAMRQYGVVLGGVTALYYFEQPTEWHLQRVDFYVANHEFAPFVKHLQDVHDARPNEHAPSYPQLECGLKQRLSFQTRGLEVECHRSTTDSPLLPIIHSTITLFMNWVGPDACASAYPYLTSLRMGLYRRNVFLGADFYRIHKWSRYGYYIRSTYSALTFITFNASCPRSRGICSSQCRYFGDRGSLVFYFHPHSYSSSAVRFPPVLPNGVNVVWRLDHLYCAGSCLQNSYLPLDTSSDTGVLIL